MIELSLSVVGADYPNRRGSTRRFEIALCKPDDPITLEREPSNPADPRAIKVLSERGVQIGYLTAERAPLIGKMIEEGRPLVVIFQCATSYGAMIRVNTQGDAPTLPARAGSVDQMPTSADFWPDSEYPDD